MIDDWNKTITATVGWTLFHSVWQITLIYGLLKVVLATIRSQHVRLRYCFCCASLALVVVATIGTIVVVGTSSSTRPEIYGSNIATDSSSVTSSGSEDVVDSRFIVDSLGRIRLPHKKTNTWQDRAVIWIGPYLPSVVGLWSIGIIALLVWHTTGLMRVSYVSKAGRTVDVNLAARFDVLKERIGIRGRVSYLLTTAVCTPATVGWLKPVVLLPIAIATEFSLSEIDALVAHELAHIRRRDYAVNLLQSLLETLFFYHPCIWLLSRLVREEREGCCDRTVTAVVSDAKHYAETLFKLTELRSDLSRFVLASNGGTLLDRVTRMVDRQTPRAINLPLVIATSLLCFACITSVGYGWEERYTAIQRRVMLLKTHEADFVFDLLDARKRNPSFEPAFVEAIEAIINHAPDDDPRYEALAKSLESGADPTLIWTRYCEELGSVAYPTTALAFPHDWRYGTTSQQRQLAKLLWHKAVLTPDRQLQARYSHAAILLASMRREKSCIPSLSRIVMDPRFMRVSQMPTVIYRRLLEYVSLSNDSLGAAADIYREWNKGDFASAASLLRTWRWGRFPEIDRQFVLDIIRQQSAAVRTKLYALIPFDSASAANGCDLLKLTTISRAEALKLKDSFAEISH